MNAIAQAVEELNRSTVDVHLLRPALERLEGVDLDRVANRVQRGLVDADTADAVDDLATLGAQVLPLARAAVGLADAALPGFPDEAEFGVRVEPPENGAGEGKTVLAERGGPSGPEIANRVRDVAHESGLSIRETLALLRLQAGHPLYIPPHMMVDPRLAPEEATSNGERVAEEDSDPVDFRRHVGDELARLDERERATWSALEELREIVSLLDQQVTRLVRTHPAGDADPEATDTKWLEETVADFDDRIHALEKRGRAERLDAGFRELMEKEIAHLKENIPGELANRLLRLERAARKADLMPET